MKDNEKRVPAGSSEPQHLNKCIVRIRHIFRCNKKERKKNVRRKRERKVSAFLLTDLRYVPVMICPDGELKQKEEKPG